MACWATSTRGAARCRANCQCHAVASIPLSILWPALPTNPIYKPCLQTLAVDAGPGLWAEQGDSACKACLCSMYRAITKAFSATQGRTGNDTELNNCVDPVYDAVGNYTDKPFSSVSWRSVMAAKSFDCTGFLMKSGLGPMGGHPGQLVGQPRYLKDVCRRQRLRHRCWKCHQALGAYQAVPVVCPPAGYEGIS